MIGRAVYGLLIAAVVVLGTIVFLAELRDYTVQ
jgi:hypothetical protein